MRVRAAAERSLRRWLALGLLAAPVGGCAAVFDRGATTEQQAGIPAAPAPAADPVSAFAAAASPGSETVAALPGGGQARLRLLRAYHAASGRECREVLVGTGLDERTRLVCRGDDGAWAPARPLLSGGGRS